MKQKILWIMCGIPGSGKSTWLKNSTFAAKGIVISRDLERFALLAETDDYFAKEKIVYDNYIKHIKEAFAQTDEVFADATQLNWSSRRKLLNRLQLDTSQYKIGCIVFTTPLKICLERNAHRSGRERVLDERIKEMCNIFTHPRYDPYIYNILMEVDANGHESFIKDLDNK